MVLLLKCRFQFHPFPNKSWFTNENQTACLLVWKSHYWLQYLKARTISQQYRHTEYESYLLQQDDTNNDHFWQNISGVCLLPLSVLNYTVHVEKIDWITAFDAIVLNMLTYLSAYLCGETGAPGVSTETQIHTALLHRCCSVVAPNSLMIWLAGQARQPHGAIITDGDAICAKQTQVNTGIYSELHHSSKQRQHPQSCANIIQSRW